jgi:ribosomal protein S13
MESEAMHILEEIGLSRCAKLICEKCNLHTFEDIGKLTSEQIESIELKSAQRKILIELVINCCDRNTYKKYIRKLLNMSEIFERELEYEINKRELARASLENLLAKLVS